MANVIEITDFTAPELDVYARLSEGQLLNRAEPEKGMFIAESPRVIERALDAGCVPVSFLSEDRHIEKGNPASPPPTALSMATGKNRKTNTIG